MRLSFLAIKFITWITISFGSMCWASDNASSIKIIKNPNTPQAAVVCTGWHALCDASTDCKVNGNTADCACWRVNENHIVVK